MKWIIIIIIALLVSACGESTSYTTNKTNQSRYNVTQQTPQPAPKPTQDFYTKQVNLVRRSLYKKKCLLNYHEKGLFWKLEKWCRNNSFNVYPQVSLGELLSTDKGDKEAYKAINSKRVDFCIVDKNYFPIAVIEYQGSGHYNANSTQRDEVKKTALECASIKYIAIHAEQSYDIDVLLLDILS
ncbi:MAG: DUF2726 domain-containing protein [Mariprofundales bacterium]